MAEPYQRNSRYTRASKWQGQAICVGPFDSLVLANLLWTSPLQDLPEGLTSH